MKLELLEYNRKKGVLHFLLKEGTASFANLLRRFAIDEVPTLAVAEVEFKDNTSALYDEIVAHRIGLIPIKTDLKSYNLMSECTCKQAGCEKCQLKITLKASKKGIVTAGEAKSADSKCAFVYDEMPIAKLTARQRLEFEATAVLGRGREHAKWAPCLAYYKKEPVIKFEDKKLTDSQKERIKKACGNIAEVNGKVKVDKEKLLTSPRFDACLAVLEESGAEITDTNNYIFTIESFGQLDCKEILEQAAEEIVKKLETLDQQIK